MKKPHSTKEMFLVEVVIPRAMNAGQMRYFIEQAIKGEIGAHMPDEPEHWIDRTTIDVKVAGRVLAGIKNKMVGKPQVILPPGYYKAEIDTFKISRAGIVSVTIKNARPFNEASTEEDVNDA